ncbi:arylamine N-acetyltransferase [Billgrantia antri]|uniref:arylamine N-acetyltransferase n=1 Tax=Billgrantia antri TaxID=2846777 RepID=UPI003B20EA66
MRHRYSRWETPALDLEAYLTLIDYRGPLSPDLETLRGLQQAHLAAVPFENLDVVTGGEIRIDLGSLQEKLVRRRRGVLSERFGLALAPQQERLLLRRAEALTEASSEGEQLGT